MGNVSSRSNDGAALYLRDQNRLSIETLRITNPRGRVLLSVVSNGQPATQLSAKKENGDDGLVEFVQVDENNAHITSFDLTNAKDPELSSTSNGPPLLLRLNNEDELTLNFTFVIRQAWASGNEQVDTSINGLTFAYASNNRELDNLVTREFHADPNLHKNANVELVGDFSTLGQTSRRIEWSWNWRPPRAIEDRGGGWKNSCCLVEYDQRAHKLNTLAMFSFWVQNTSRLLNIPGSPSLDFVTGPTARIRVPSSQSVESRTSEADTRIEPPQPPSPNELIPENMLQVVSTASNVVSCQRPGEDMSAVEDGPLFRATMKALEQKTGNMRTKMKKVLKKAEAAQQAQVECNDSVSGFIDSLREASRSNANAIQPAMEHYFEKIAREILQYEKQNTQNLQKLIIDPLSRLYNIDLKQAEAKRKDFEDESRDYYAYVGRYLGQRQDSLKEKKRAESDTKYQSKRRNFELKRFDYSSFMQDLHGGRKEQEVLSHLTRYADAQTKGYLSTAKKIEDLIPQLEALSAEVKEADKEYRFQRTEREEKRRTLEKSTKTYVEPETSSPLPGTGGPLNTNGGSAAERDVSRDSATPSQILGPHSGTVSTQSPSVSGAKPSLGSQLHSSSSLQSSTNRFKGIRDLEEKDYTSSSDKTQGTHRKEGLLWALSRPGSHADPKGLNKQAWHKFWIVLDQGKLSEYSNWKQRLDLHMEPIDLRMASVREARSAERRFCFEVITPQYKRVYQATSEEDMNSWISAVNNALQSAVEGRGTQQAYQQQPSPVENHNRRDIGSVFTGKSTSLSNHSREASTANSVSRRITVGSRPPYVRSSSNNFEENPDKLLQIVRGADQGNCWCAECGSGIKTEWVSINLGIVLCIECSGIHRSLGTHVSKVRSLTLDVNSFTTDIVELLLQIGNRVSNMVWEATYSNMSRNTGSGPSPLKPVPQSSREERLQFITAKYVQRMFVQSLSPTLSAYSTPDETLLASVKKNDLKSTLHALALRANPNVTDKSRNTHVVFLALAAADPAQPGTSGSASSISDLSGSKGSGKIIPFPAAELLVQNGSEIPRNLPAFPLSLSSQLYVEQKTERLRVDANGSAVDAVSTLPMIGEGQSDNLSVSHSTRERLQKRVSAGGRIGRVDR